MLQDKKTSDRFCADISGLRIPSRINPPSQTHNLQCTHHFLAGAIILVSFTKADTTHIISSDRQNIQRIKYTAQSMRPTRMASLSSYAVPATHAAARRVIHFAVFLAARHSQHSTSVNLRRAVRALAFGVSAALPRPLARARLHYEARQQQQQQQTQASNGSRNVNIRHVRMYARASCARFQSCRRARERVYFCVQRPGRTGSSEHTLSVDAARRAGGGDVRRNERIRECKN